MTSKLLLLTILITGIAIGVTANQFLQPSPPPTPSTFSDDTSTCERVCYVAIKFAAFVDFKIEIALKLATLIPNTELACTRICTLPKISQTLVGLLKDAHLKQDDFLAFE